MVWVLEDYMRKDKLFFDFSMTYENKECQGNTHGTARKGLGFVNLSLESLTLQIVCLNTHRRCAFIGLVHELYINRGYFVSSKSKIMCL